MTRLRLGFRGRQVVAMTAVAAVVAIATSGLSAVLMVRSGVSQVRENAELIGRTLYRQVAFVVREHWPEGVERALGADPQLRRIADSVVGYSPVTVYVAVVDDRGRAVFHSDPDRQGRAAVAEASLDAFSRRSSIVQTWQLATTSDVLALDLPFRVEGEPFGVIRVAVSTVLLRDKLSSLIARNAVVSAAVVLLAFGLSFFVADKTLAPVERLRAELARLDLGDERLELRTEADADRIAALFSSMARELARRNPDAPGVGTLDVEDGMAVLDAGGRVLASNEPAARMLRHAGPAPLRELVESVRSDRGPVGPVNLSLPTGTGDAACLAHAWPLPPGGAAAVVILRDVDRATRLSAELAHSRKLGAVGRIGSGVSHEVKNALNAIVMHAELLRRQVEDDSSVAGTVDVLDKELRRLAHVVESYLQFTRPEALTFDRIDLGSVIDEAVGLVAGRIDRDAIRLEIEVPTPAPATRGDGEMLRQALVNLLINACDAMPDGGIMRISAVRVPETGASVVRVEDTGVGIPRERLSRIFDLFHSTKPDGSGIGLSTVYRIVHMHGGRIEVESEPGRGTRFTMTLPGESG